MTDEWREILSVAFYKLMDDLSQTKEEENARTRLIVELKEIVRDKYPDVEFSLFGSSSNGFGMKKSDVDICMTLQNCPQGEVGAFKNLKFNLI